VLNAHELRTAHYPIKGEEMTKDTGHEALLVKDVLTRSPLSRERRYY